jgi:hypothetical protein
MAPSAIINHKALKLLLYMFHLLVSVLVLLLLLGVAAATLIGHSNRPFAPKCARQT